MIINFTVNFYILKIKITKNISFLSLLFRYSNHVCVCIYIYIGLDSYLKKRNTNFTSSMSKNYLNPIT